MAYINYNWGKMSYKDLYPEKSTVLVFLHGSFCNSASWDNVINNLSNDYRTIKVNFRGHGISDVPKNEFTINNLAEDVIELINSLSLNNVTLVGHSLGGMVAMIAAEQNPDIISGLILLEGWTSLEAAQSFPGDRFYGNLSSEAIKNFENERKRILERFAPEVWNSFWESVRNFNGLSFLENSSIPIFEVYGDKGKTETTEKKLLVPEKKNITTIWIPGAGHFLPHEKPGEVAEICHKANSCGKTYAKDI